MTPSPTPGRILAACGILLLSLALLSAPAAASDRSVDGGQLLLWLLGLSLAPEHQRPKIDINSATIEELRGVPGIELRQALRIIGERPYAKLEDLARVGLSSSSIRRLAGFLAVDPDWSSALPATVGAPTGR